MHICTKELLINIIGKRGLHLAKGGANEFFHYAHCHNHGHRKNQDILDSGLPFLVREKAGCGLGQWMKKLGLHFLLFGRFTPKFDREELTPPFFKALL